MKKAITCLASLVLCGTLTASAQDADVTRKVERLDTVAKSYLADNAFMGAVLVADGDRLLLDKGYGMADLEWSIPNAPDVCFRLGSLTKQFTAALVLLLQQDGKLHIEDPVSKYLPDAPKAWEKITLANLLGHTSGIPNFTNDKAFETWKMSSHTHEEEVALFRDKPLVFEPGSQYAYSNSNYEVLGTIIEKVSGRSYGDLLQERLFQPLGMMNSGLDTDELILPRRAQGYQQGQSGLEHARSESLTVPWAAGGLYSTTGDLLRWERGLFGGKVLNEASLKAMTSPGKGNYGLGVGVFTENGAQVIKHAGGIEGFNTQLTCAPQQGLVVVVLSNVDGVVVQAMGEQLLNVAMGRPVILKSERKPVPVAKEELARCTGVYEITPDFMLTIAVNSDSLTLQATGSPLRSLMYQGAGGGRPRFFAPEANAEVEFVPDKTGAITSLILHRGGDIPAQKR